MKLPVEIWNIAVVSFMLMLVYAAMNPACALLNTALDDSTQTQLDSTIGYFSQSMMSIVSIPGALLAPWIQQVLGTRLTISLSALLHIGLYLGMIFLDKWLIYLGSIASGFGMGVIWVVVPNFVTQVSKYEHIERNMSYHLFAFTANGMAGSLLNYLCLTDTDKITADSRVTYYFVCCLVTIFASLLTLFGLRKPFTSQHLHLNKHLHLDKAEEFEPLTERFEEIHMEKLEMEEDDGIPNDVIEEKLSVSERTMTFVLDPAVMATAINNIYFGTITTLMVMIPTSISNTYDNRYLIPLMGMTLGVTRVLISGSWDVTSRLIGYSALLNIFSCVAVVWSCLVFLIFPSDSSHEQVQGSTPLISLGEWVVYVVGILTGYVVTAMGILVSVTVGKVSQSPKNMCGFDSSVLFSYTMIVWSISNALCLAASPYMSLYLFLVVSLVLLVMSHYGFKLELVGFLHKNVRL